MFDRAESEFGALDILMNNAGVDASGTKVAELSTEVWDRAIRVNLYGYFFCCRRFARIREAAGGGGKVINVTSVHEDVPNAGGSIAMRSNWRSRWAKRARIFGTSPVMCSGFSGS